MQIRQLRENEDSTNPHLREYIAARSAFDQAKRHLDEVQAKLIEQMQLEQTKKLQAADANGPVRSVTYVQNTTYEIDQKGLRRALTAKVFDRYTTKTLDRKALERAMSDGEVDPMVVARFVTEKPGKPYLRYTEKEDE